MAVRDQYADFSDPVLRRKTKRVLKIDKDLSSIWWKTMMDTLEKSDGAGLAAPQVGVSLRVVVLWMPDEEPFAIINPGGGETHRRERSRGRLSQLARLSGQD